jgi:hypothetical protein
MLELTAFLPRRGFRYSTLFVALTAPWLAAAEASANLPASLGPSLLLENLSAQYDHWQGIGRLESLGNRHCTAVLVDTRSVDAPADAPAYVLTSGHCAYPHKQSDLSAAPLPMRGHIEFNFFRDTAAQRKVHQLKRLHWSSQRGRDLAIIELQTPLQQLIDEGVTPLALAAVTPPQGVELLSVSAPLTSSGYTLRVSSCPMEGLRDVVEHPYVWRNNLRTACTDVLPGSSGSPLIEAERGTIVGIMGTTTRGAVAQTRCATDSPCEVENGAITWHPEKNYATRVDGLGACFAAGVLDTGLEQCDLQDAFTVIHRNPYYQARMTDIDTQSATWQLPLTLSSSHYAIKATTDAMACEDPSGYSDAYPSDAQSLIDPPLDTAAGMQLLCVLGMNELADEVSPAALKNVYIAAREVTEQPVGATSTPIVTRLETGRYNVQMAPQEPHQVRYEFKFGAPDTTDCNDRSGYKHHSYNFNISPRLLPVTLCTQAFDAADRASPARADLLEAPEA